MSITETPEAEVAPVFNVERAEEVLRAIFSVPHEHKQESWFEVNDFQDLPEVGSVGHKDEDGTVVETRTVTINTMLEGSCGTTACIAGWASLLAGWQVRTSLEIHSDGWEHMDHEIVSPQGEVTQHTSSPDFEAEGARALGLTDAEANELFFIMDERYAISALYSRIKFGDASRDMGTSDLAEHFGIEMPDDDDYYEDEELDHVVDQIVAKIREEYPPLTVVDLMGAGASADGSA